MITLFHRPKTRSSRFIFLLEELEAPYQLKFVTTRTRDGTGAVDPANPHPHGKVPAISDDRVIVFESPAIAIYLTDKFPKNHLGPLVGEPERGAYLSSRECRRVLPQTRSIDHDFHGSLKRCPVHREFRVAAYRGRSIRPEP
jgi:glutathione S-transferase